MGISENSFLQHEVHIQPPILKRKDLLDAKEAIASLNDIKSQKIFIKKRNRVIQNGWRDGILGVDMPGDAGSHFYTPEILKQETKKLQKVQLRNTCKSFFQALNIIYFQTSKRELVKVSRQTFTRTLRPREQIRRLQRCTMDGFQRR